MALIGFARVSTVGQSYEEQIKQLEKIGCFKIFVGKNSGEKGKNRARLDELLNFVREGDTIVVTKLDRLGRSTSQILSLYEELENRGVGLKSLDGAIDTEKKSDPFDKNRINKQRSTSLKLKSKRFSTSGNNLLMALLAKR